MKKTIKVKLRDLTPEQWDKNRLQVCDNYQMCHECPLQKCVCMPSDSKLSWINNKDTYSNKFLNQEVKIEVENSKLTKEEVMLLKLLKSPDLKWITKDKYGTVHVYYDKPTKDSEYWRVGNGSYIYPLTPFSLTFDFLSWEDEEPTNIQELLKEYENE